MIDMNALRWIAFLLLVVGGLNWGLVGILHFDIVAQIFGQMSSITRIIYVVVGIAALYLAIFLPKSIYKG